MNAGIVAVLEEIRDVLRTVKKGLFEGSLVDSVSVNDRITHVSSGKEQKPLIQLMVMGAHMGDIGGGIVSVRITALGIALVDYADGGRGVYPDSSEWRLSVDWVDA